MQNEEVDVLGCPLCAVRNGDFQLLSSIGNWHMPKRGVSGHGNHRWFKFQVFLLLSNLSRCGWHFFEIILKAMQKEENKNLLGKCQWLKPRNLAVLCFGV